MTLKNFDEYLYFINTNTDFTGVCIVLHPNGQKEYEHNLVNGKYHGKQYRWHSNGQESYKLNYVNGFRVGVQLYEGETCEEKPKENSIWLVVVNETL